MNEKGKGFPIYRMNEIHDMFCAHHPTKYANINDEEAAPFFLNNGDVLYIRTNESYKFIGKTGIYYESNSVNTKKIFASYLVKLVANVESLLPEYLTAFLNTNYATLEIHKRARQSNQINIKPEELKEIEIPIVNMEIQRKIQLFLKKHLQILFMLMSFMLRLRYFF